MKYIVYKNGREILHAWSDPEINHKDMADVFERLPIVSAGFIVFKDGMLQCVGRSDTLSLSSRPRDTMILNASINASTSVIGG